MLKWEVTLNDYSFELDKLTVNVKVTNIGSEKAMAPYLGIFDALWNVADDKIWAGRVADEYLARELEPGQSLTGSKVFLVGPLGYGQRLVARFAFVQKEPHVEFSLGR